MNRSTQTLDRRSAFRNLKLLVSLSPRTCNSLSTLLGPLQCEEETKDFDQFCGVIQDKDKDLLKKAPNGNILVLHLIDRGAIKPQAGLYHDLFKKCTDLRRLKEGQMVHSHFLASKFKHSVYLQNTLMNMYAKCGDMELARKLFDGMTEWNTLSYNMMISGYSQSNEFKEALGSYRRMLKMGLRPNRRTFAAALKSAGRMQSDAMGRGIHATCIKCGCEKIAYVGSALVDMYTRCDRITEAKVIFDGVKSTDQVSWNVLIAAYARKEEGHNVMKLFTEMKRGGFAPNQPTYYSIFAACASIGALEQGKLVHADMIKSGVPLVALVGNALLDMYGKAGSIEDANKVFYRLVNKDVVSWSSMLTAYAHHGLGQEAVDLFEEMRAVGFQPNEITFLSVLKACSHAGLLDKGLYYFELMREYKLEQNIKHYATIVDLLGRAGQLHRAERFIRAMPILPTANVWKALLGACRMHKNMELGAYAAEHVIELDPTDSGAHVLLYNIYASADRRRDAARVKKMMHKSGVKKEPAYSWVEIEDAVHVFKPNDDTHPQIEEIRIMWGKLLDEIKKIGYVPDTSNVFWLVDQQEKDQSLQSHCEKLALVFALLNTPHGTPISIKNNIRVCNDCHAAFRFVSKLIDREITLRDSKRFHHFRHGSCSCRGYW